MSTLSCMPNTSGDCASGNSCREGRREEGRREEEGGGKEGGREGGKEGRRKGGRGGGRHNTQLRGKETEAYHSVRQEHTTYITT